MEVALGEIMGSRLVSISDILSSIELSDIELSDIVLSDLLSGVSGNSESSSEVQRSTTECNGLVM